MIFLTVGAQMPFNRLIRTVDRWASQNRGVECFAQIGPGGAKPWYMRSVEFVAPDQFEALVNKADLLVAHAGMGSIIKALELGKPILVMPRRGVLQETRNDHKLATAKRLSERGLVDVALDEEELSRKLDSIGMLRPHHRIADRADDRLIHAIHEFAHSTASI